MKLTGSLCALITPFASDGSLDERAFESLIDRQLAGGTHGLVIAGSTGEASMLDAAEYARALELAVARVAGRVPVLAGTGTAATSKTIELTRFARDRGVDAALVVTPYYVRPTQEGLYQHYRAVAEEGGLPVVLYNVPGRTGCDLKPETVARLKDHANVVGVKEAVGDASRVADLVAFRGADFVVLSGDDPTARAAMLAGADGVISVAANIVPGAFAELCDHARAGRSEQAGALDAALQPLYDALAVEPNPIPAKWLLHRLGLCGPDPRLPLTPLSPDSRAGVEAVLENLPGF